MNYKVVGGKKLSGTVQTNTSKNAAVVLLCASLLNKGKTTLKSMPRIEEVKRLIEVLESIGVGVTWKDKDIVITPPSKLDITKLDNRAAQKTRSISMFIGPLCHLFKEFTIPHPGGCKLGARSLRPHIYALEELGLKIESKTGKYHISSKTLHPAEIVMYESSDTGVENVIMAAAKIPGKTTIKFASSNYMVQDLCVFLMSLGVRIEGLGSTTLVVHGLDNIDQNATAYPSEDPIESMFFLSLAATTGSEITIKGCPIDFLELELLKLEKMGFKYTKSDLYKSTNKHTKLVDITTYPSKLVALEEKIYARPFPGINIDNLPFFVPIATQAKGRTLIHDWVYENRALYYMEFTKLGSNMVLADPHRIYIDGPSKLQGAEIICPPALRPATIILIAMLKAKGESLLRNIYSINRGYENLHERLRDLGADIEESE